MAGFCSKCGSPLPSNTGFCPACGTSVASVTPAAAAPPQYAAVPPPAQPVAYGAPPAGAYAPQVNYAAPPAQKGSALKIILIVIAILVGLGILGAAATAFTAYRVMKSAHINTNGDGVTINGPGGASISAGQASDLTADELGVPLYPGATHKEKGGFQMKSSRGSMIMGAYTTSDSPEAVLSFYRDKLGSDSIETKTGTNDGTVLQSGAADKKKIMITVAPGKNSDEGKTTFVIMNRTF